MGRNHSWFMVWLFTLSAVVSGSVPTPARAQQLKPYFLVIVDTSGSMEWCAKGQTASLGNNDCTCHTNDNDCTSPYDLNRCGFPSNKIGDAKCALQRILDGAGGDATFGLMQFSHPCSNTCASTGSAACGGMQQSCGATCGDAQLAVPITVSNANLMREWVDGQCQGACGANEQKRELTTGWWTPLATSLRRANEYLRGQHTNINNWPYVSGGTKPPGPLAGDGQLQCRPVSVILLTDGDDTCSAANSAPMAAGALYTGMLNAATAEAKAFKTYVIGFGSSGGNFNETTLNNIAASGGTNTFFAASNEAELSVALNRIIADAQPPSETCNNLDDDCDGKIDEGLPKFCNKPAGVTEKTLCDEPGESVCDKQDDDCDGVIDEGKTNRCGECGDEPKEVCDNVDNDCDSHIDENTDNNGTCGVDTGECRKGNLLCLGGAEQCKNAVGPKPEQCDCKDNDCDGSTDEAGSGGLCPTGQRCAGCQCVEFCDQTSEFLATCKEGLTPQFQPNGECLCIVDKCDHVGCPKSTQKVADEIVCAPDTAGVGVCVCKAGACVPECNGVTCASGEICQARTGRCVDDSCRGLGCAQGERCDPGSGACVEDACAKADCGDRVCRNGDCEDSCANVSCKTGEVCKSGRCSSSACTNKRCETDQICDESSGDCIVNHCAISTQRCKAGQVCTPSTGDCEADPCWNVNCPSQQFCSKGECVRAQTPGSGAGGDGTDAPSRTRLLATGGGGCACSVPGAVGSPLSSGLSSFASVSLLLAVWRMRQSWRRKRLARAQWLRSASGVCVLGLALWLTGCRVSPLCIDCVAAADSGVEPSAGDGATTGGTGAAGGQGGESGEGGEGARDAGDDASAGTGGAAGNAVPRCEPTGDETCNDKDDDCDFKVDEMVRATTNTCSQVGVCAGTEPVCANGAFTCRFGTKYETDETLCDGADNDCDGRIDEAYPMLGTACDVGVGACKTTGKFTCALSGKSLSCDAAPGQPGDEVCNGKDDDCDGMTDEPKAHAGTNTSYVKDDVVKVNGSLWIYKYEASRVDAAATAQGLIDTRACSRAGVLPWTNVTYTEAATACQSVGMTVCNLNDWVAACRSGTGQCKWGSTAACSSYVQDTCNGHNASTAAGQPDTDALLTTGSKPNCFVHFDGGDVFDLSGNAKEWAQGSSTDTHPVRGGSYNNGADGLRCDFDFTLGNDSLRLPNIGFRCCSAEEP